jgi:3-hydroxyacyl-CoA dehydrogenase/enoyl-CoA hydratase/3-hydroxybutyryl-CoA epimerase
MNPLKCFSYVVEDGVAVITFDIEGESVNTLSPGVSAEFEAMMTKAASDAEARGVVFISGKKDSFIVGANVELLQSIKTQAEAVALSKQAQAGFDRLDAFEKPVVAAIHGACLGGGLEWALACDYRIGTDSPKTTLGLPETQLGVIPGAGGTQRLPRLVGAQLAIELILSARTLKAKKALKMGILDEIVPAAILKTVAISRAQELVDERLRPDRTRGLGTAVSKGVGFTGILRGLTNKEAWSELALEENPLGRKLLFDQAKKQLLQKTKGKYPAQEKALEVIRTGLDKDLKAGLDAEAAAFGELLMTDVSKRLVEMFFATTALKKENGTSTPNLKPRELRKVGVLGGGLMGSGIAFVASAVQGVAVRIKEEDDAGVRRALINVKKDYDERVKKRSMSSREAEQKLALVSATTDFTGFSRCELVIESVFEDVTLKQKMIREVEAVCGPTTIFASNTSSIPITTLAEASKHPETVVGVHYFSPVAKMPLLEVITHKATADWVTATCVEAGKAQGKTVIVVNDGPGFYTSRMLAPYLAEAGFILSEGADVAEIDRALVEFGFPVGPLTLLDEVGLDVAVKVATILHESFGPRLQPPESQAMFAKKGRLGRKVQKGFYLYGDGSKKEVDPAVYELLPFGKERRRVDRFEIAERCVLRLVNEAVRCLGEGVLRSARDGDIGAVFGLGFPPFLGGPFRYADAQGIGKLLERTEHYEERFGARFEPAPLFAEYVKAARKFY